MRRPQKGLSPQSQWTLILVGGLAFIYLGAHWQDFRLLATKTSTFEVVSSAILSSNADRVEIARFGISVPIIYSDAAIESKIQVQLQKGVVHLAGTANPGEPGNVYIVGHSSNYKGATGAYNEVFKRLPEIMAGDVIEIVQAKKVYRYQVYETHIVRPTELWVMSQETSGEKILTLQTSYPVGTAKERFIAVAKLIE